MKNPRIDIGSIRREQIVEAAAAVITEQGLQNLSLSEIEKRAGMSRGQLTYYFRTKESILLAVFDRHVQMMHERVGVPDGCPGDSASFGERYEHLLGMLMTVPPVHPEFNALQYTFLSQIGHREDFRERLATLYAWWRSKMTEDLTSELGKNNPNRRVPATVSPQTVASLLQAILHGLVTQTAADPDAIDREEMMELCLDLVSNYLGVAPGDRPTHQTPTRAPQANGSASSARRVSSKHRGSRP